MPPRARAGGPGRSRACGAGPARYRAAHESLASDRRSACEGVRARLRRHRPVDDHRRLSGELCAALRCASAALGALRARTASARGLRGACSISGGSTITRASKRCCSTARRACATAGSRPIPAGPAAGSRCATPARSATRRPLPGERVERRRLSSGVNRCHCASASRPPAGRRAARAFSGGR